MSKKSSYEPNLQGHLPVLDGVRGIAILMVILFHTTIIKASAPIDDYYFMIGKSAWLGVDLFFVLSGFLITGILYDTKGSKRYFKSFYLRRTVRIFPLYYAVVFFCLFVASDLPFFGDPGVPDPWPDRWWYWLYGSNFLVAKEGFRHIILGPTWSLAIEEQFYLVWPLLVFFFSRKSMMVVSASCILLSVILRIVLFNDGVHPTSIYVMTPTRLDGLASGAFVALAARGPRGLQGLIPWAYGLAAILTPIVGYFLCIGHLNKKLPNMILYGYVSVALLFAALFVLILRQRPGSLLYKIFSSRFLCIFGKYSYALYLFNRPLVGLVDKYLFNYRDFPRIWGSSIPGQIVYTLIITAISFAMAIVSWHIFEKHFLKLKKYFPSEKKPPLKAVEISKDLAEESTPPLANQSSL